ncbi:hypothetical protein [Sphingobacterium tabacisoli]|uniref:DUF4230 domain-containing protein n=1 Tax=Sphingobacterium tabacisoli TaxID=2044855 RepID=A0ABW5L7U3_9SPHI|nr:hypothetical protein [Sphingobacterium tabacisoli]
MRYIKVLLVVLLIVVVYVALFKVAKLGQQYLDKKMSSLTSAIPKECLALLSIDSTDISFSKTVFVDQSAISSFAYKDSIFITAVRLDASPMLSLTRGVNLHKDLIKTGIDGGVFYAGVENLMTKISYSYDYELVRVNSIDIHLPRSGDIKSLIQNDTLCSYFIPNSYGFKVRLNDRNHSDIVIETSPKSIFEENNEKNNGTMNMLLCLRRYQDHVYLFLFNRLNRSSKEIDESALNRFIVIED